MVDRASGKYRHVIGLFDVIVTKEYPQNTSLFLGYDDINYLSCLITVCIPYKVRDLRARSARGRVLYMGYIPIRHDITNNKMCIAYTMLLYILR